MGVRSFVQNIKSGNVSGAVGDAVGIALGRMAFDDMTDLSTVTACLQENTARGSGLSGFSHENARSAAINTAVICQSLNVILLFIFVWVLL